MQQKISYKFKRYKRAKYMRIIVHEDGEVVVTGPKWVLKRDVEAFVRDKQEWIVKQVEGLMTKNPARIWVGKRGNYLRHKEQARVFVHRRIDELNQHYGFKFNKISIRNQKTCWGSCSSKKNLNFNYKIIFLAPELADYIIVHELCHLAELNHSARFWKLVGETVPEYEEIRKKLRQTEGALRIA